MSRKQLALFEPTLVVQALKEAVKKLNPQAQWRNPVMFIVWIGSLLTTCISIAMASGAMPGNALFSAAISGWLWSPYCSPISPRRWQKAAASAGQQS
ncbi:potassium-transporting ATPase B chain [Escherichia coli]